MIAVTWSLQSKRDFRAIIRFTEEHFGTEQAVLTAASIRAAVMKRLAKRPEAGRARPEFGGDVRSFPVSPFVVFYEVRSGRTRVLRIIHGRRDIQAPLMSFLLAS